MMHRTSRLFLAASFIVPCLTSVLSGAAPEWTSVFDGQSLKGWKEIGGGKWSVAGGEIVGENGDGRYGWLVLEKPFTDFVLELECKHEAPGNSGIQFRSHYFGDTMTGYQAEFDPRPDHGTGGVYEEQGRGWLKKPDAKGLAAMKPMEWNRYRIRAVGDHIQLFVNDVKTVDFHDTQARSGIIALQVHSGKEPVKVRWRNIRVQDLGDGEGWQAIFDGKSLKGWHTQGEPDCWRVEKGELIGELVKPSPYAYLATDKKHGDYELKIQMLFESNDGNSGVFFRCYFPPQCAKCGEVARKLAEEVTDFKCPKCAGTEALPLPKRVHIGGPQAEFAPPGNNTGALYEGKWLNVDKMNERKDKMHRFHEWNEMVLKVVGDHIFVYLNGYQITDLDYPMVKEGNIALQLHAGQAMKVRFKDIQIRAAKAAASQAAGEK